MIWKTLYHYKISEQLCSGTRLFHDAEAHSALRDANTCPVHDIDDNSSGRLSIVTVFHQGES